MKEKTQKADIIEQPKQGFNLHGYKHNYIFFFNSDRHLELIDFFLMCVLTVNVTTDLHLTMGQLVTTKTTMM